jgi:hypothetical protein
MSFLRSWFAPKALSAADEIAHIHARRTELAKLDRESLPSVFRKTTDLLETVAVVAVVASRVAEIKRLLGYGRSQPDKEILKHWKSGSTRVCKPCWELRYCLYGPPVEQAPLLPGAREEAVLHHECLACPTRYTVIGGRDDGRACPHRILQHFV